VRHYIEAAATHSKPPQIFLLTRRAEAVFGAPALASNHRLGVVIAKALLGNVGSKTLTGQYWDFTGLSCLGSCAKRSSSCF
jgi:hypothetical protein